VKSYTGFVTTLITAFLLLAYFIKLFLILTSKSNPQITQNLAQSYYSVDHRFTFEEIGFKVAWAMEHPEILSKSYVDPNYVIWLPRIRT
jgi:hypothetical protein